MNILNVEKVSKTYGEKELFNNISLGINSGDKIGLIGVNGTGKSTLLKIIAGVEEPDEGQVVKGKGIELAYLAQTPLYYENENVLEYVMRGKHADSQPKAKEILNKLGITNHASQLSMSQQVLIYTTLYIKSTEKIVFFLVQYRINLTGT